MDYLNFNYATSPGLAIPYWNMRTQYFLKYHLNLRFVDRTLPRNQRQLAPFAKTFACSILFHGFFHGFTSFFIGLAINDMAFKAIGRTKLANRISDKLPPNVSEMISRACC